MSSRRTSQPSRPRSPQGTGDIVRHPSAPTTVQQRNGINRHSPDSRIFPELTELPASDLHPHRAAPRPPTLEPNADILNLVESVAELPQFAADRAEITRQMSASKKITPYSAQVANPSGILSTYTSLILVGHSSLRRLLRITRPDARTASLGMEFLVQLCP